MNPRYPDFAEGGTASASRVSQTRCQRTKKNVTPHVRYDGPRQPAGRRTWARLGKLEVTLARRESRREYQSTFRERPTLLQSVAFVLWVRGYVFYACPIATRLFYRQ